MTMKPDNKESNIHERRWRGKEKEQREEELEEEEEENISTIENEVKER